MWIGPAATEIARKANADFFIRWIRVLIQECRDGKNLSGSAETSLKAIVLDERFLDRVKGIA